MVPIFMARLFIVASTFHCGTVLHFSTVLHSTSDVFTQLFSQDDMQNRILINKTEHLGRIYEVLWPSC